ncbi:MAG: hypothetical protein ACE5GO_10370 [Anaerolineales bacterium]
MSPRFMLPGVGPPGSGGNRLPPGSGQRLGIEFLGRFGIETGIRKNQAEILRVSVFIGMEPGPAAKQLWQALQEAVR